MSIRPVMVGTVGNNLNQLAILSYPANPREASVVFCRTNASVLEWGADPTGAIDSTKAFQDAIDNADVVIIPPVNILDKPVFLRNGVSIQGQYRIPSPIIIPDAVAELERAHANQIIVKIDWIKSSSQDGESFKPIVTHVTSETDYRNLTFPKTFIFLELCKIYSFEYADINSRLLNNNYFSVFGTFTSSRVENNLQCISSNWSSVNREIKFKKHNLTPQMEHAPVKEIIKYDYREAVNSSKNKRRYF